MGMKIIGLMPQKTAISSEGYFYESFSFDLVQRICFGQRNPEDTVFIKGKPEGEWSNNWKN